MHACTDKCTMQLAMGDVKNTACNHVYECIAHCAYDGDKAGYVSASAAGILIIHCCIMSHSRPFIIQAFHLGACVAGRRCQLLQTGHREPGRGRLRIGPGMSPDRLSTDTRPVAGRLAAEIAEEEAEVKGPGSVRVAFLDQLYLLNEAAILQRARITEA